MEHRFDATFATKLALKEKQIQQNYRPIIGIHKWFARRPGTVFRSLLLAEFCQSQPLKKAFFQGHSFRGLIADPFMGGGTPLYEANRLGFDVLGCDINPLSYFLVWQSLSTLDREAFVRSANEVLANAADQLAPFYQTRCLSCSGLAPVKYFLWVKTCLCPFCKKRNDLFPGYRLAEAVRHPCHVLVCPSCGSLQEFATPPRRRRKARCSCCGGAVHLEGNVAKNQVHCVHCEKSYPLLTQTGEPFLQRMWAIEYHCSTCYGKKPGRLFKVPEPDDHERFALARQALLLEEGNLPLPQDPIPRGDETDRLHRWGIHNYRQMFNERQLVSLGVLLRHITQVDERSIRHGLLTVFSDSLRYQNMLCRYDPYALKCQDIFSLHGFPVGPLGCENNVLGIPSIGSGSFCHFVEKFLRAKEYCAAPFETKEQGGKKTRVYIQGETVEATCVVEIPRQKAAKEALLIHGPSQKVVLPDGILDGVFTDPPYFNNLQYAELMDFCYTWLHPVLREEIPAFAKSSTRRTEELTGNTTLGRGLAEFASGLSAVFVHFAKALKPGAPFVFTYHHNDPEAYVPLIVAILDAGMVCTKTFAAAAEMNVSLHIRRMSSSTLDSIFVCRKNGGGATSQRGLSVDRVHKECRGALRQDQRVMARAGISLSLFDRRCLLAGHLARLTIQHLQGRWLPEEGIPEKLKVAGEALRAFSIGLD